MQLNDFTSMQIDGQEITELRINDVLVWEKNNDLTLSFTGNTFKVISSSSGLIGSDILIDWGDGTTTNYTSASDLNHTYSTSGNYSIKISGVTSLEKNCFYGTGLTSVVIPKSVTSLGVSCFNSCTSLTSVMIPKSVTNLGNGCFSHCTSLTSVVIPESVTRIERTCFDNCTGLTNIVMPDSITYLGNNCFWGCTSLTSVMIPENVTHIDNGCFYGCTGLTSVVIPNSVTKIGFNCFYNCSGLRSLILNWIANPPTYNSTWITNTLSSFKFSIPYGTTSVYTAAKYPSNKLIERPSE